MKALVCLLAFSVCALAGDGLALYEFRFDQAIVTPANLEKTAVPFEFSVEEKTFGMVCVTVSLSIPEPKKGVADRATLIVSKKALPSDPERDFIWVHDATHEDNQKSIRVIELPSEKKRIVQKLFTLSEADARRAAIRVHYQQLTYGGDEYWILIGRFMEKANQTPEPTATLVTPRADARVAPSAAVAHL